MSDDRPNVWWNPKQVIPHPPDSKLKETQRIHLFNKQEQTPKQEPVVSPTPLEIPPPGFFAS